MLWLTNFLDQSNSQKSLIELIHRIVFHCRKGSNNLNFLGFQSFKIEYEKQDVESMFQNQCWDTSWAKGIIVFDDAIDNKCAQWLNDQNPKYRSSKESEMKFNNVIEFQDIEGHDHFEITLPSFLFHQLALHTKSKVTNYLWNEDQSMFYDYNCVTNEQITYQSVTCLWALWAGLASIDQAKVMVPNALQLFEVEGGLVSGTEESRGITSLERPNRQWDYPYGWAPHQILAWRGLQQFTLKLLFKYFD